MADNARWFVVHTDSGYENKVASNIETAVENRKMQDQIFEVRVPTETVTEIREDQRREVVRKLFPGYVLVKVACSYRRRSEFEDEELAMSDEAWYLIRNTRGVTGFVGPGSKPIPLTEEEVAKDALQFDPKLLKRVDELELSVRANNRLKNDKINWLGELVQKTEADMLKTPNFGRKSLNEIKIQLEAMGLGLGMEVPGWPPENIAELAKKYEDPYK